MCEFFSAIVFADKRVVWSPFTMSHEALKWVADVKDDGSERFASVEWKPKKGVKHSHSISELGELVVEASDGGRVKPSWWKAGHDKALEAVARVALKKCYFFGDEDAGHVYGFVKLLGSSSAVLWENSSAVLRDNSRAELCGDSSAVLCGNSRAELRGNSRAELCGNSRAELWENSRAELRGNSRVTVFSENCRVKAWNDSVVMLAAGVPKTVVELHDNARIEVRK